MRLIKGLLLIAGFAFISSCGDDAGPSDVNVKLQAKVGTEDLVHNVAYDINGTQVQFTNVAFYIGDMTFNLSNQKSFTSSDRYLLVKPGVFDFNFSEANEEEEDINLTGVSFIVGVDDETNSGTQVTFDERDADDPLAAQTPSMHWGWANGYRYLSIDAEADLDGDGTFETPLTYHLGGSEYLKSMNITVDEKLEVGENAFTLDFDLATFLGGLDFNNADDQFTKANLNNPELGMKILANYDNAFSFAK